MDLNIRSFEEEDLEKVLELTIPAWRPIFSSFERLLGSKIYSVVFPDWKESQKETVEKFCTERESANVLVAEIEGEVIGFLSYELKEEKKVGEIMLLAVDPEYQERGIGTKLNDTALQEMKEAGMKVAAVDTGGDESHAPARRSYEKAGFSKTIPSVRYYKRL